MALQRSDIDGSFADERNRPIRPALCDVSNQIEINPVLNPAEESEDRLRRVRQVGRNDGLAFKSCSEVLMIDTMERQVSLDVEQAPFLLQRASSREHYISALAEFLLFGEQPRTVNERELREIVRAVIDDERLSEPAYVRRDIR